MAPQRERPTAADVIVAALSPILIMGLVGSLVFFLAEVFYAGKYSGRLQYTLFFFVFGAVLVSRIAIEADAGKAWMYGLALGAAVFLALQRFVEYPPDSPVRHFNWLVNLGLMGVIW